MFTFCFFIILDRKSLIKVKHNLFLPIFIYGIHYRVQFMVLYKILKKILYKSRFLDLERIKIIYNNSNNKNCFAFRTIHFSNSFLERIMFDNRGLTVTLKFLRTRLQCFDSKMRKPLSL